MANAPGCPKAENRRSPLKKRGLSRFMVLGLDSDRDLIRTVARRLAEGGPDGASLRALMRRAVSGKQSRKGGILAALRRSPLVGVDLDLMRSRSEDRDIDL